MTQLFIYFYLDLLSEHRIFTHTVIQKRLVFCMCTHKHTHVHAHTQTHTHKEEEEDLGHDDVMSSAKLSLGGQQGQTLSSGL